MKEAAVSMDGPNGHGQPKFDEAGFAQSVGMGTNLAPPRTASRHHVAGLDPARRSPAKVFQRGRGVGGGVTKSKETRSGLPPHQHGQQTNQRTGGFEAVENQRWGRRVEAPAVLTKGRSIWFVRPCADQVGEGVVLAELPRMAFAERGPKLEDLQHARILGLAGAAFGRNPKAAFQRGDQSLQQHHTYTHTPTSTHAHTTNDRLHTNGLTQPQTSVKSQKVKKKKELSQIAQFGQVF